MFAYSDPVGGFVLEAHGALEDYRIIIHGFYRQFARLPNSAFTLLDAFDGVSSEVAEIPWIAFPRTANASNDEIDRNRFTGGPNDAGLQDEYTEWRVEADAGDGARRITFVTEFPEYYEALAGVSLDAIQAGIADAIPGANPTADEIFGPGFDPGAVGKVARQRQFVSRLPANPWQNGEKGILCLAQRFNTVGALFNLVGECGVLLPGAPASACENAPFGACGPARNSDPRVCTASQELRRADRVLSLEDPVGIRILELGGIWKRGGQQIDINDPASNQGAWAIMRQGRRAVLTATPDLTLADEPVTSGAQVARVLRVGAHVRAALEADVPAWARTGQEASRVIV